MVKFRLNVTPKLAEDYGRRHKLHMVRAVRYIGKIYIFEASAKADYSLLETAIALTELDDVEYAEPNLVTTSMLFAINPAAFLVAQQWLYLPSYYSRTPRSRVHEKIVKRCRR